MNGYVPHQVLMREARQASNLLWVLTGIDKFSPWHHKATLRGSLISRDLYLTTFKLRAEDVIELGRFSQSVQHWVTPDSKLLERAYELGGQVPEEDQSSELKRIIEKATADLERRVQEMSEDEED